MANSLLIRQAVRGKIVSGTFYFLKIMHRNQEQNLIKEFSNTFFLNFKLDNYLFEYQTEV